MILLRGPFPSNFKTKCFFFTNLISLPIIVSGTRDQPGTGGRIGLRPCDAEVQRRKTNVILGGHNPQCDQSGYYKSMQCDIRKNCWCVERENGRRTGVSSRPGEGINCDVGMIFTIYLINWLR